MRTRRPSSSNAARLCRKWELSRGAAPWAAAGPRPTFAAAFSHFRRRAQMPAEGRQQPKGLPRSDSRSGGILACVSLLFPFLCSAHEVITTKLTWTQEISRIVYKHCASCHREGGAAPMPLLTYDET